MDTPFNPTPDDDLKQVLAEVPPPIRAFIASGKVQVIAKNLMQKNQLHIDQGAIVGRELILLLLGINTPSEFTKTLSEEARLDEQTISGIVNDLNMQIFVPLREEMKRGTAPVPQPARPPAPVNARVPSYAPLHPASNFNLQNKIPPPARPQGAPTSARPDLRNVLASVTGEKLLEDHEEPHIEFKKLPMPPANLPGVIQSPKMPEPQIPKITPPAPMRPPYSSDPYRESIE